MQKAMIKSIKVENNALKWTLEPIDLMATYNLPNFKLISPF